MRYLQPELFSIRCDQIMWLYAKIINIKKDEKLAILVKEADNQEIKYETADR